jgi:mycothiol S-conjugate amidase
MGRRHCVLAVHAHPDDESSKGAATMAMYAARGIRTVLVTCTGGEAGDVLNSSAGEIADLVATRRLELEEAVHIIGYESTHLLGYQDSGMDGAAEGGFATADLEGVVQRLVSVFRAERPDVVVTYDAAYAAGHPDHLRCHEAALLAFERAASRFEPGPTKLYGTRTHSPSRLLAMHQWLLAHDLASPYADALSAVSGNPTTTKVEVSGYLSVARRALQAHRSQVRPDEPWFFAVPLEALCEIYPWEDYELLRSRVSVAAEDGGVATDLFSGVN